VGLRRFDLSLFTACDRRTLFREAPFAWGLIQFASLRLALLYGLRCTWESSVNGIA